ncbi:MAG TPA: SPFH domain-containing protein [Steroidobacteraceae bacterium]|jgi:regulator of protease activity HflC (stomatin/prohibitin superfamily)|nr:SPFH domain-containing protein [Steroidobacteraceae bacterium]
MSDQTQALIDLLRGLCRRVATAAIRWRVPLVTLAALAAIAWLINRHPPFQSIARGEVAIRTNVLTGSAQMRQGSMWVVPLLHQVRYFCIRDQIYRPEDSSSASGSAPFQSVEGLSLGVDLTVRYALDPSHLLTLARALPDDIAGDVVAPAVKGVIYPLFASYTVKEIFTSKRAEIQKTIEEQLRPRLAADGIVLKGVQMGEVDLPSDYREGMEKLLAEELESEKMRFTLELKDKQVRERELEGEADKVRRKKAAEAAADEEVIAARAQEEAMKHVLPFKQKQVEQRRLEAEAEKVARIRSAEGSAEARRIEASGEADSRVKLADAEVYRLEKIGKTSADQMEREGVLISQNPLLIQKAMADKLSDKVQVIIAAPPAQGGFIGSNLIGAK